MDIPVWANMDELATVYWGTLADEFERAGTLSNATLPEFIKLCKNLSRRDTVDDFLSKENSSLVQESVYMDSAGQMKTSFRESIYSKLSRDLDRIISVQLRTFRPKPVPKRRKKKSEFFND